MGSLHRLNVSPGLHPLAELAVYIRRGGRTFRGRNDDLIEPSHHIASGIEPRPVVS